MTEENDQESSGSEKEEGIKEVPDEKGQDIESLMPDEIELDDVDSENAETLLMAQLQRHSGPLPSPDTLAKYKEISPRAVDWIFEAATKEQDNRHWCDKEPLRQSRRAQTFAFIIAILVIIVGPFHIYDDKSVQGLATLLVPLATILGVFVYKEVKSVRSEVGGRSDKKGSDEADKEE